MKKKILIFGFLALSISALVISCKKDGVNIKSDQKTFGIFTVQNDNMTVHMNGDIDSNIGKSFDNLKAAFPDAKRIVMLDCPGSSDDEANLKVAKQMHDLGYEFHLTSTSTISSGAVDMYVSGVKRTMEKGAKIGVHSWSGDPDEPAAISYPKGHEVHLQYINYYISVGFTRQQAEDFYYFTINSASAEDMHWMTEQEIKKYNILKGNNSEKISTRTEKEELDFMRSKAKSLTQNNKGYWEANLGNGLVFIYVPAGTFTMGNNAVAGLNASPAHKVTLSHYWISKTPITKGQFRQFVNATNFVTDVEKPGHKGPFVMKMPQGTHYEPTQGFNWRNAYDHITAVYPEIKLNDNHPVSCVSWNDAIAYTNWLKQEKGITVTLPTEAEWEYAARGTDGRVYPWGNEIPDGTRANYADETMNKYFPNLEQALVHFGVNDGYALTSPVGSFPKGASPIGALDMAGNLTEWVYDSNYDYTASAKTNPVYTENNGIKMQKAGFWSGSAGRVGVTPDEIADGHNIRADARQGDDPASADDHLGFRVAISYTARQ